VNDHFDYLLNELLRKSARRAEWFLGMVCGLFHRGRALYAFHVLEEYRRVVPAFHWSLLATDISTKVLGQAVEAVYDEEKVAPVPYDYKKRYLLKSKDPAKRLVRVKPELRGRIEFRRLNFMDEDFGIREKFDVIFCRNVIIYFDRPTQEKLIRKFYDLLLPGGSLFLGHSETLTGMNIQLRSAAPTVYTKA
jgi:chemotaxis protein methyltransferase CheR